MPRGRSGEETLRFADRAAARAFLRSVAGEAYSPAILRQILLDVGNTRDVGRLPDHEVLDLVADALVSGRFQVREHERSRAGVGQIAPAEEESPETLEAEEADASHWIEIEFIDSARNPVPVRYDLRLPGSEEEQDQEAADGRIDRRDLSTGGTCTVLVYGVVSAEWAPTRVAPGTEATVRARVEGYADDTSATIEIFRLHRETAEDVLETLSGTVTGGRVEAAWTPEGSPEGAGEWSYVAKVTVGDHWKKTRRPLVVAEPGLTNARWSAPEAEIGDDVGMSVEAVGLPDGTEVTFTVFRERYTVDDDEVATASASVSGEEARTDWTVAGPGDGATAVTELEYYFRASADEFRDDSDPLWVDYAEGATQAPGLQREDAVGEDEEAEEWEQTPYVSPEDDEDEHEEIESDPEGPTALEDEA